MDVCKKKITNYKKTANHFSGLIISIIFSRLNVGFAFSTNIPSLTGRVFGRILNKKKISPDFALKSHLKPALAGGHLSQ
jgi:hypothetical protein